MSMLFVALGLLIVIAFMIPAIIEGKKTMKKGAVIRTLYFYLASLITLTITVGSLVYLVNLGLKTWVLTGADIGSPARLGQPPMLFFNEASATDKVAPTSVGLTCDTACQLTETQKTAISSWKTSYQSWIEVSSNPGSQRARDAVAALSFFIIAFPFFIVHFRVVQRDARTAGVEGERTILRPIYFYFVSLGALLMMVIAGGFLINVVLKTWVFPSAGKLDTATQKAMSAPVVMGGGELTAVQSIVTCGDKCGIDAETIALAKRYQTDYDAWNKSVSGMVNNAQRQAASAIPYVVLGIPLFWYHWAIVRKESRERKENTQSIPPNPTS